MKKIIVTLALSIFGFSAEASAQFLRPPFRPYVNVHALSYGGSPEHAIIGHVNLDGATRFWISFWFRRANACSTDTNGSPLLASDTSSTNFHFQILGAGTCALQLRMPTNPASSNVAFTTVNSILVSGTWQHVLILWDSDTGLTATARAKFYVDGTLRTTTSVSAGTHITTFPTATHPLKFALRSSGGMAGTAHSVTELDEVMIGRDSFPDPLQVYNGGRTVDPNSITPRPIGCWTSNNDELPAVTDSCGVNNGILENMEVTDFLSGSSIQL